VSPYVRHPEGGRKGSIFMLERNFSHAVIHGGEDRRTTQGISRGELDAAVHREGRVSGPIPGERAVLTATGDICGEAAEELAGIARRLDPIEMPLLTLDVREVTALDPVVIHALMHAWERRGQERGCIRILAAPGSVLQYLDLLGLQRALDIVLSGKLGERLLSASSRPAACPPADEERDPGGDVEDHDETTGCFARIRPGSRAADSRQQ